MNLFDFYRRGDFFAVTYLAPLTLIWARLYMGLIFFRAGLAKLSDFEETIEFFTDDWALPFLSPAPAAYLATTAELVLPLLLFLGLFTRIGALGLLIMTVVIQVFVLPLQEHYLWMVILTLLFSYGGGALSVDHWLYKRR